MSMTTGSTASQCAVILAALKAGRALTPLDALQEFRCFRLAARIHDLRGSGHSIITNWGTDGDKRWAIYQMVVQGGGTYGQANNAGSTDQTSGL